MFIFPCYMLKREIPKPQQTGSAFSVISNSSQEILFLIKSHRHLHVSMSAWRKSPLRLKKEEKT